MALFTDGRSLRTIRRLVVLVTAGSVLATLALKVKFEFEAEAIPETEMARPVTSRIVNVLIFISSPFLLRPAAFTAFLIMIEYSIPFESNLNETRHHG